MKKKFFFIIFVNKFRLPKSSESGYLIKFKFLYPVKKMWLLYKNQGYKKGKMNKISKGSIEVK